MTPVLSLEHVSKGFGTLPVLRDVNFDVSEHSIFGFIGANGAGKTTTMKLILGLLPLSGGEICVCGERVAFGDARTNRNIGFLPDVPEFYGYMTPVEYLRLCGRIAGMATDVITSRSNELLRLVGLGDVVRRRIRGYSRGMKQRLGIAQALLNQPRLLICDEPTSALDPIGRKEILDILSLVRDRTTVVFSTHILSDVERICDRVAVLNKGVVVLQGGLAEIKSRHSRDTVLVEADADNTALGMLAAALRQLPFVSEVEQAGRGLAIHLPDISQNNASLLAWLVERQVPIMKYEVMEPTLESLFMEVAE